MIVNERPPNFELIHLHFPNADKPGVMFAYDGKIYNPSGIHVPPALVAHEEVHLIRQRLTSPSEWWNKYILDGEFRYVEELHAHVAELKAQQTRDRNLMTKLIMSTAARLVAPLYNYEPPRSLQQAMKDIRREAHV